MIKSEEMMCENMSDNIEESKPVPEMKRKNRRAKKSRNKIRKLETALKDMKNKKVNGEDRERLLQDTLRSERLSSECKKSMAKRRESRKQVFLRPTNVPLLNAPKNSTQFIIDDHENSNLFWNFHDSEENDDLEHPHPAGLAVFPGQYFNDQDDNISPDDDTFWAEYSERDFETVYETAHQEKIAEWSKKKLVGEISCLERRQRELVDSLSKVDPKLYLQKLQSELLSLQETNRKLRLDLMRSKASSPFEGEEAPDSTSVTDPATSSSSSTTSSSSSSSSSSDNDGESDFLGAEERCQ